MLENIVITAQAKVVPPEAEVEAGTFETLPDFNASKVLGKKGTRNMDRLTALTIYAVSHFIEDLSDQRTMASERLGVVLGTAQGSIDSIVRFVYDSLVNERPDLVSPSHFANTTMNCAAGLAAVWYGLKGINTTVSTGELSALSAMNYAVSIIEKGYNDTVIAGGVEDLDGVSIAAKAALAEKRGISPHFTEASSFFVFESEPMARKYDRRMLARVQGVRMGYNPFKDKPDALVQLIRGLLVQTGIPAEDIVRVSVAGSWPQTRELEMGAVHTLFDHQASGPALSVLFEQVGNTVSCNNALQLDDMVSRLGPGENGLLFAQDFNGNIGAMVVSGGTK